MNKAKVALIIIASITFIFSFPVNQFVYHTHGSWSELGLRFKDLVQPRTVLNLDELERFKKGAEVVELFMSTLGKTKENITFDDYYGYDYSDSEYDTYYYDYGYGARGEFDWPLRLEVVTTEM